MVRRKLFEDPLCEECGAVAEEVHHVVPLRDGGGDPYALDGLASLCKACHSRATRAVRIGTVFALGVESG
jgi:5-methylcytosine-specific restriction endonuclease McrA